MRIVNVKDIEPLVWDSPKKTFGGSGLQISEALGRDRNSTDVMKRHPFDVELATIPPHTKLCPYHSHSAQWEFYHVLSGTGQVRHEGGLSQIGPGDAFIFKPGEAHQVINDTAAELVLYVVADNPMGESFHYPDSKKWGVQSPERRNLRSQDVEYYDGEE
jgi:uncharacterized cupin superfamily protein